MASVRIGSHPGQLGCVNPTFQQLEYSDLDIVVAGSADTALTHGRGWRSSRCPESEILDGLQIAHDGDQGALVAMQVEIPRGPSRSPMMEWTSIELRPADLEVESRRTLASAKMAPRR